MRILGNKPSNLLLAGFLLIITAGLSACGSTASGPNLLGGAGLDVETSTSQPSEPAPVVETPTNTPVPAPTGHLIFVSNRDGQNSLYMTSADGVEQTRLTSNGEDADPHISPDGTRVAFVSTVADNMDVYVLDLATLNVTRITDAPEKDTSPTWSPDGTRLAFESFRDGNFEIYMVNADGSNPVRLTNDPAGDSNPVWSPVGDEIAFVSNRFGNSDIMLLTTSGAVSTLTTNPAPDSAPAWSPNGSMIAFKTHSGDLANLCVIGRDGLNQHCVTTAPSEYGSPIWSPDGNYLAASAKQNAGYGLDVFNIVDNSLIELSSAGVEPRGNPVWSPEGTRLAFQAQSEGDMELYEVLIPTNEFTRLTYVPAYDGEPIWGKQ